ncbi:membrane protein, putative [Acidisarcina polymorpha]|uniref:Membrane protein, putative n=1 Tax=Acidisarcina polymorpha TaxID=2211140 RepID=A0A2Z5FS40_9BACT|nr:mechanosensitive ion channel domain-containing protein [Acidisarcina polymorpha]AXC09572.1 membrane protein, putative [Acidisarcina polymorpha]
MGTILTFFQSTSHTHTRELFFSVSALCVAIVIGLALHFLAFRILARIRKTQPKEQPRLLGALQRLNQPARYIVLLTGIFFVLPWLHVPLEWTKVVFKTLAVLWFASLGWLMVSSVYMLEDLLVARYDMSVSDNLRARRIRTQMQLLRRMAIIFLIVIDAGLILSVFRDSSIWHYGAGLLASAGLASLVLATAAKSSAENLLAGLQIALTEPIRLDDVVIVEGEWGKIEEITTTYVVVKIWDLRRLVVPLTYFIEKPFQNWTRQSSNLLGTAFLYVDYSVPVEALRQEFTRVLEASKQWDRAVNALQVTDVCQGTLQIRCLASSANASDLFDLRCIIREEMIGFIQKNYPDAFPRTRFAAVGESDPFSSRDRARDRDEPLLALPR